MKKLIFIIALTFVLHSIQAYAFHPIIPPANDYNMQNIKANFDSIQAKTVVFPSGSASYVFDFPCETTSPVLATINTSTSAEITFVQPLGNQVNIVLNASAATDLTISLFTILNN